MQGTVYQYYACFYLPILSYYVTVIIFNSLSLSWLHTFKTIVLLFNSILTILCLLNVHHTSYYVFKMRNNK